MKLYIISVFSLTLFFISCNKKIDENKKESNINISDSVLEKVKNINKKEFFVFDKAIQLETKDECLIGAIEQVLFLKNEGKIAILDRDNKNIFIFDENGKYLNRIGNNGSGPYEYLNPMVIAYGNSILAVFSDGDMKIILFSLEGVPIKEIDLYKNKIYFSVRSMSIIGSDLYLYNNQTSISSGPDGKNYRVIKLKNYIEFEKGYDAFEETFVVGSGAVIEYGNKILFNGVFNGKIYEIYPEGNNVFEFANIGKLCNTKYMEELKEKGDPFPGRWLIENSQEREVDYICGFGRIKNFLFIITKNNQNKLLNNKGEIIRDDIEIPTENFLPENFNNNSWCLAGTFQIINEGIITCAVNEDSIRTGKTPNPSILFYKLNL